MSNFISKTRFVFKRKRKGETFTYFPKSIQSCFYNHVESVYGNIVHDENFSPFVLKNITYDATKLVVDVVFLRSEFLLYLQANLQVGKTIFFGNKEHIFEAMYLNPIDKQTQDISLGVTLCDNLGVHRTGEVFHRIIFNTPYSSRKSPDKQESLYPYLLPELPILIKQSLGRLELTNDKKFPFDDMVARQLPYQLSIENVELKTKSHVIDKEVTYKGVVGYMDVRFIGDLDASSHYQQWLAILDFLQFAGVGQKTSLGMGSIDIRVLEKEGE